MDYFYNSWFDEDANVEVVYEYRTSKHYCYKRTHVGDVSSKWKRIRESEYISAYETQVNA